MNDRDAGPVLLTARQVAAMLQIPVSSVYDYARREHDALPSIRIGGHRRFRRDDVDGWLDDHRRMAA
jgi:excisionase family DNA binding protein